MTNIRELVAQAAGHLRLVQLDAAARDPQWRREMLAGEVRRFVEPLSPEDRAAFFEGLAEQFPSWDSQVDVGAEGETARSGADRRDLDDWSFLVTRLLALAPSLEDEERQVIRDRLAAAGLVEQASGWSPEDAAAFLKRLGLPEDQEVDPARAAESFALLLDVVERINQAAWLLWSEVRPTSRLRGVDDLRARLGIFLAEGGEAAEIARGLERLRQLVAAILSAIAGGARIYATRQMEKFSVEAIKSLEDRNQQRRRWVSREARYWERYRMLADDVDCEIIRRDILDAIGDAADRVMGTPA